jgi:hypothetical protein
VKEPLFSLASCGFEEEDNDPESEPDPDVSMMKVIIAIHYISKIDKFY